MVSIGHFLELSVPADDIQKSLSFYRELGFTELQVGDIRNYFYAVVTDGRIAIGLHGAGIDEATLTFVKPSLAEHIRDFEDTIVDLSFQQLGLEQFHEAGFYDFDGHRLMMMEARTFSRTYLDEFPVPLLGHSTEISLRCQSLEQSVTFWEEISFVVDDRPDDGSVNLMAPGITVGLRQALPWPEPVLRFRPENTEALLEVLKQKDIRSSPSEDGYLVTSPEGTRLLLVTG